ncbi:MAG: hypothetical protein AB1714_24000 [Acidobacteriota bacterium]
MFYLMYLIASIAIAVLGMNKRFGFWGYFFASIFLTPIIGLLLLLAAGPPSFERGQDRR